VRDILADERVRQSPDDAEKLQKKLERKIDDIFEFLTVKIFYEVTALERL